MPQSTIELKEKSSDEPLSTVYQKVFENRINLSFQ